MAHPIPPLPGTVGWIDLTVANADAARDFYSGVIGWKSEGLEMSGYRDYVMTPDREGATPVAGVCHARGINEGLPSCWLVYFIVADLDAALDKVAALGGSVVRPATNIGPQGRYAVIRDPAGAACAIFEGPK